MQEIFTDQVVITSNISKVWDYFVKLEENGSEWLPGITSISKVSDGELGYNSTYHFLARGKKHTSFVSSYEDLRMITLTSVQGNFRANYTYSFREQGNETVVTIEASCEAKGFVKLLSPIIKIAIKKTDGNQLKNFKGVYEAECEN